MTGRCISPPKSRHRPRLRQLLRLALSAAVSVRRRGAGDAALYGRGDGFIAGVARRLYRGALGHSRPHRNRGRARLSGGDLEFTAGQNGFLTAALIGGALGLLERRPALAGICLGLLTYKPQFGLLFPFVLIADRRWTDHPGCRGDGDRACRAAWLAFGGAKLAGLCALYADHRRFVLGEGHADSAGCKACSVWSARMAAANRWPGAFKRR